MINIFEIFGIFIIVIFLKSLLECLLGKKNYMYELLEEVKKIKKKKKFYLIYLFFTNLYYMNFIWNYK